jgi:hypothetical protein
MSLWGNKDSYSSNIKGTITFNIGTKVVTGSGTSFTTAGISTGDILVIGAGATYGQAVVTGVTSDTQLSIGSTQFIIGIAGTVGYGITVGVAYTVTQKPKYTLEDSQYFAPDVKSNRFSAVFGVDITETGVAGVTTVGGKAGAFAVSHAGWVGVTTYNDMHGNLRVKSETLVAGSMITGDANDDAQYPDS